MKHLAAACRHLTRATVAFLAGATFVVPTVAAQKPSKPPKPLPAPGLSLAAIAGQHIPVLPTTYVLVAQPTMHPAGYPVDRARRLLWADSIIIDQLTNLGPAVSWLSPDDMRKAFRRAGGMLVDPDRMGQDMMAGDKMKTVFDPLLGYLRRYVAMMNAERFAMIPAVITFSTLPGDTVRADVTYVLADTRTGAVIWRSHPVGLALNAADALASTIAHILPDQH
ncbi:MAG TPA: hypothetical protein VHW65_05820 [Gemmatimonadales bacterium]|nr:hypothetical protein [Gemmatimonadales bacterium]